MTDRLQTLSKDLGIALANPEKAIEIAEKLMRQAHTERDHSFQEHILVTLARIFRAHQATGQKNLPGLARFIESSNYGPNRMLASRIVAEITVSGENTGGPTPAAA